MSDTPKYLPLIKTIKPEQTTRTISPSHIPNADQSSHQELRDNALPSEKSIPSGDEAVGHVNALESLVSAVTNLVQEAHQSDTNTTNMIKEVKELNANVSNMIKEVKGTNASVNNMIEEVRRNTNFRAQALIGVTVIDLVGLAYLKRD